MHWIYKVRISAKNMHSRVIIFANSTIEPLYLPISFCFHDLKHNYIFSSIHNSYIFFMYT